MKLDAAIKYIENYWNSLWKDFSNPSDSTFLKVLYPHLVPGGVFDEFYYWDSYFSMLGLAQSGQSQKLKGMVDNFLYLYKQYQLIPNGNRTFYLDRSQPPFISQMARLVYAETKDQKWLAQTYPVLKEDYEQVWLKFHGTPNGLSRYWHSQHLKEENGKFLWEGKAAHEDKTPRDLHHLAFCESGWDYGPRFEGHCQDFNPADLNCILYQYESDLIYFGQLLGKNEDLKKWEGNHQARQDKINQYLWSEKQNLYLDYDFKNGTHSSIKTAATFFPLWSHTASPEQAQKVVGQLKLFEVAGGMTVCDQDYGMPGTQWNYPMGWAPIHWIAIQGLENYQYQKEAKRIAEKLIKTCLKVFEETGKFWECYNVVEQNLNLKHRYEIQPGFGWTNGVLTALAKKYFL